MMPPLRRHYPTIAIDPDTAMEVYAVELPNGRGVLTPRRFLRATAEQRKDYAERTKLLAEAEHHKRMERRKGRYHSLRSHDQSSNSSNKGSTREHHHHPDRVSGTVT
jgi:GrpB-like predicted nucleotidyltransferase (UPF0157 family)